MAGSGTREGRGKLECAQNRRLGASPALRVGVRRLVMVRHEVRRRLGSRGGAKARRKLVAAPNPATDSGSLAVSRTTREAIEANQFQLVH